VAPKLRSRLEDKVQQALLLQGVPLDNYERVELEWILPQKVKHYTPDFQLSQDVFLEAKGLFSKEDRDKTLHVLNQYPEIILCIAFYNADYKIYKGSKTTYGDWCNQYLIPYIDVRTDTIPGEWING
jgi:hypothetical protein